MSGREFRLILIAFLIGFLFMLPTSAMMGYDIIATVDSSYWEIHRDTQSLDFGFNGSVNGFGNFSKYTYIEGFAGFKAKEISSSPRPGKLSFEEIMVLRSREGPVLITTKLKSDTNESINATEVIVNESAEIDVEEKWVTGFGNYKTISYLGPAIRNRERYENNGDVIATSIDSRDLSKEHYYIGKINGTRISVNITPSSVRQVISANKTSLYELDLKSIGERTHLYVVKRNQYGDVAAFISEDYKGKENMSLSVNMTDYVIPPPKEEVDDWIKCCFSGEVERKAEEWQPQLCENSTVN